MPFSVIARAADSAPARRFGRLALVLGGVAALGACSSLGLDLDDEPPPPCPTVRIDRDTAQLVQYAGQGRDITDMTYAIEIQGYGGACEYEDDEVIVQIVPQFLVERGPAAPEGTAPGTFSYFVAIPSYYPNPAGKQVFPLRFAFADPVTPVMAVRDDPITLTLPRDPGESLADEDIYIGLQLTPEQLQRNRERAAAGAR
ncbi:hypothetical protein [Caenispirillum salinarum]|uniref:hypothetical protein n=1 Tax=Caenispirillum salinarum TaxID=859058 RepID=UPI00384BA2AB